MGCLVPIFLAIVTSVAISIPILTFQAQGEPMRTEPYRRSHHFGLPMNFKS